MAATKYTYPISTAFPNGKVDSGRLTQEIHDSLITVALDHIDTGITGADNCDIWFKAELTIDFASDLDAIVAVHSGEPLGMESQPVTIEDARYDEDHKQVVVPTPAPRGSFTWYTSHGDQLDPPERGNGDLALMHWDADEAAAVKTVEIQFVDDVYVHDGEINWSPIDQFKALDNFSVYVAFPATPAPVENVGGTGNCNVFPYGSGNVIVPADGDGGYDVDLTTAVPLPDSSGYWHVNEKTGVIVAGEAVDRFDMQCSLADFAGPNMYLIRKVSMNSPRGIFEIDAYLVEWLSRRWKLGFEVNKQVVPTEGVDVIGLMMLFRWSATI